MHAPFRVLRSSPRRLLGLCAALAVGWLPAAAGAVPITGVLSITGSLTIGASSLDFQPAGGGTGGFQVVAPETGAFAVLTGTSGTILDLDASSQGVGVPFSLANFMTFAAMPGWSVTLKSIAAGVFPSAQCAAAPAVGQTCTPTGSSSSYATAFDLVNTPLGSTLSFDVSGTLTNAVDSSVTDVAGVVTAQFVGQSYQQILAALVGGGTVSAAYSASFQATVPEPATVALVALAGAGLAWSGRRRSAA